MKKVACFCLFFIFCATPSMAAIARVGSPACAGTTVAATSEPVTYSATAGNTLVVEVSVGNSGQTASTVTDNGSTGGSTYVKQAQRTDGNAEYSIWTALVAKSSVTTITATPNASAQTTLCVQEYSGVSAAGATNTNSATTGTTLSVSVTTTANNSWIVAGSGEGTSFTGLAAGASTTLDVSSGAVPNRWGAIFDSGNVASSGTSTPINTQWTSGLGGSFAGIAAVELKATVSATAIKRHSRGKWR